MIPLDPHLHDALHHAEELIKHRKSSPYAMGWIFVLMEVEFHPGI